MNIYTHNNTYQIEFPYNPKIVNYIKAIGAKWNGRCWWLPLSAKGEIDSLTKKFCKENPVTSQPEKYGEIPPMPELSPEHKEILSTQLLRQCYHYQEQGVAYNLAKRGVINADDMGGGKTTTTISSIVAAGLKNKPTLIVCKGSGKFMWEREFKIVAGMKSIILTDSIKDTWYQYYTMMGVSVFITNYESVEKFFVQKIVEVKNKSISTEDIVWRKHPLTGSYMKDLFDCIVLDESHEIRNETTIKSVVCVGLGYGKSHRFALSGTPVVNNPFDLYPQLNFIGKTKNTKESRKNFIDRYCGGRIGGKPTNLKELHYSLSISCYFRRNSSEFGIDLPPMTLQLSYCEITNKKEYDHMIKDLASYLKEVKGRTEGQIEKSMNAKAMVMIGVAMEISARGKLREAIAEIDEALQSGNKIVVFVNQKLIKDALIKHYPTHYVISGEENASEKNANETAFNRHNGPVPIFVSIKAGGVGINLQEDCWLELFIEFPWHPAFYYQCVKRVHRNGVKNPVIAKNLLGKGTIDERIWQIIETKKDMADTITGTDDSDVIHEIIDSVKDSLFASEKAREMVQSDVLALV